MTQEKTRVKITLEERSSSRKPIRCLSKVRRYTSAVVLWLFVGATSPIILPFPMTTTAWRLLVLLATLSLSVAMPEEVPAQEIRDTVEAGSVRNQADITVTNTSAVAPVEGLRLTVVGAPRFLANVRISPDSVVSVPPGQSHAFTVAFDVLPDAPAGQRETLIFQISASGGTKIDFPNPRIVVDITRSQPVAARGWRPPVYRLVLAEGKRTSLSSAAWAQRCTTDLSRGVAGGTVRCPDDEGVEHELSMRFTRYPQTFTLGQESIEFDAEVLWRLGEYPPSHPCRAVAPGAMYERQRSVICPTGSLDRVHFPSCPDTHLCTSTDGHGPGEGGRTVLRAVFKPASCETNVGMSCDSAEVQAALARQGMTGTLTGYNYELWFDGKRVAQDARAISIESFVKVDDKGSTVVVHGDAALAERVRRELADVNGTRAFKVHIAQRIGAVTLYYLPILADDQRMAEARPYQFPDAPLRPGVAAGETGETPTELAGLPSPRPDDFSVRPEPFSEADSIVVASALNPLDPEVMQHMQEWLSIAEPPENATGAKLRYTTWGQVEGTVPGGRITATRAPDDAGSRTPAEYLWSKRDQLPSLNHCTLGAYVVARLNRASIDHCKSARAAASGVLLIDVAGMPALQAKQALERQRLQVKLNLAEPAPTSEQASVVKMQQPVSGTRLKEKELVALDVYGDYARPVVIPKLIDQPGAVARRMLADLGLNPTLRTIGTAPSATKAFRVFDVAPGEGATLRPNSPVAISAYGPYEDRVAMPDVVGMDYQEAGRILSALGLNPTLQDGNDVADQGKAYKIYKQEPMPGTKITPRQTVQLSYHGRYVFRGKMPNLQGLAQNAALTRVEALSLRVVVQQGEPAPAPRQSGTVSAQSIAPGRDITEGDSLALTVFDTSIEEQLAAANCGALPGTVAEWDSAGRKAVCKCKPNLRPAADGRSCVAPQRQSRPPDPGLASLPPGGGVGDDSARRQEEEMRRRQSEEQQRRRQRAEEEARRQEHEWAERERACERTFRDAIEAANRGRFDVSYGALKHAVGLGCDLADADRVDDYIRRRQSSMPQPRWIPPTPTQPKPPIQAGGPPSACAQYGPDIQLLGSQQLRITEQLMRTGANINSYRGRNIPPNLINEHERLKREFRENHDRLLGIVSALRNAGCPVDPAVERALSQYQQLSDPRGGYPPPPSQTGSGGKVIPGFGDAMGRRPDPTQPPAGQSPPQQPTAQKPPPVVGPLSLPAGKCDPARPWTCPRGGIYGLP